MIHVAGKLSEFANVATDPSGLGMKFCVILSDGDYVEFVLHETECHKLLTILKEAFANGEEQDISVC
jgi:hypothetical protein